MNLDIIESLFDLLTWFAATVAVNLILRLPEVKPSALTDPRFKLSNSNSCCKVLFVSVLEGVESLVGSWLETVLELG